MVRALLAGIAVGAALVGCGGGGGGGGGGTVTSTETFQLATALTNYVTSTASYRGTISGTALGAAVTGTVQVTQGALGTATFEGRSVNSKVTSITGTVVANGANTPVTESSTMYFDSTYTPLGRTGKNDYEVVVAGSVTIPMTVKVNDTGALYTLNRYATSAKITRMGTTQVTYVIEPDTASTAILKLIETEKDTSNKTKSIETVSFQLTPSGGITRKQETVTDNDDPTAFVVTY